MKAFIVDDETISINNLETLIQNQCPEMEISGRAKSVDEALLALQESSIDLLFLDIEMPGRNGFHLLEYFKNHLPFRVIFVTAHSSYAIQAIKYSALDYLLKPVQAIELKKALVRLMDFEPAGVRERSITALVQNMDQNDEQLKTIVLTSLKETRFVAINNIVFCKANNNYTIFHLMYGEEIVVSKGLYEYNRLFSQNTFIRCHQSYLVNKFHVIKLVRKKSGIYLIVSGGLRIPVSRIKKHIVENILRH